MTFNSKNNLILPIYEQAADWLIELRNGDADATARERLDTWLRASPEHIRAYLELSAIWEDGADVDLDHTYSTEDLIARARGSSNVIALNGSASDAPSKTNVTSDDISSAKGPDATSATKALELPVAPQTGNSVVGRFWPHRLRHTRRRRVWAVATVIACVVGGTGLFLSAQRNLDFETGIGEQRFVKLVDGSTMELNSRSRIRIRYSSLERDVDLIEGQALFHVAKDPARPFIVHSGSTLVRAVGTQFDVYRKSSGTTITVVEGRVAVLSPILDVEHEGSQLGSTTPPQGHASAPMPGEESPAPATSALPRKRAGSVVLDAALSNAPNAIYLAAGEQITVSAQAQTRPTHADTSVATAWTQHELVFDSTPLIEVAQDFNRYNTRQLIVSDAALRDFHISGVFSSADPASLLKFLRAQRDIIVEETDDGIRVSKK
jgi:transmembrane sensor